MTEAERLEWAREEMWWRTHELGKVEAKQMQLVDAQWNAFRRRDRVKAYDITFYLRSAGIGTAKETTT